MKSTRKLTLEEKIRRQLELHDRLQKAREKEKPFRVFSATDDWIHIVEWKWNEMWVIYTFKFKWYSLCILPKSVTESTSYPTIALSDSKLLYFLV